jgi:hypothetical protein
LSGPGSNGILDPVQRHSPEPVAGTGAEKTEMPDAPGTELRRLVAAHFEPGIDVKPVQHGDIPF